MKTHCVNGHEFSPENTCVVKKTGARVCRQCTRDRANAARKRDQIANKKSLEIARKINVDHG